MDVTLEIRIALPCTPSVGELRIMAGWNKFSHYQSHEQLEIAGISGSHHQATTYPLDMVTVTGYPPDIRI